MSLDTFWEARSGAQLAQLEALAERLLERFKAAGAVPVAPKTLQPADTLLDLYGEDIRARAYTVREGFREMMLRPDFTVPIARRHMENGAAPARYCYRGPVWRRPSMGSTRPSETLQVGFELFDEGSEADADAEVFALISDALGPAPVSVATGDIGILRAAVEALATTPERRRALLRHIWRPARFQRLLDRFSAPSTEKTDLLKAARDGRAADLYAAAGKPVGLRSEDEVLARVAALAEDAAAPPLSTAEVDLIRTVLGLKGVIADVADQLDALAGETPAMARAAQVFRARAEALDRKGCDVTTLPFEGSFGRTTLEYYDGFVFGFVSEGRVDLPVIASGGRYDALTRALGGGREIPAVGAIIRPEALMALDTSC